MGNKSLYDKLPSSQFGISGDRDASKRLEFDTNDQVTNSTVTVKTCADTAGDITITLPPTSGTLGYGGDVVDFSKRYWTIQHWNAFSVAGTGNWSNTAAGAGVNLYIRSATGDLSGAVTLHIDASSPARVVVHTNTIPIQLGQHKFVYSTRLQLSALSVVGDVYTAFVGFGDTIDSSTQTDCAMFAYSSAVSDNWCLVTNNGGVSTVTDTGVPATTSVTALSIVCAAGGLSVQGYINDVLVATSTTNIPTGVGHQTGSLAGIYKTTGTTPVDLNLGPVYFEEEYL